MTRALVFDSGVGGLTIADALRKAAPDWIVDYAADSGFFPYGVKTDEELRARLPSLCATLVDVAKPHVLVIACNTASTLSLADIRAHVKVPVVGTVPAIKPAAEQTRTGVIGILATPGTVRRAYLDDLERKYATGKIVIRRGSAGLVDMAERAVRGQGIDQEQVTYAVKPMFDPPHGRRSTSSFWPARISPDPGCHREACPPGVRLIDTGEAVARQAVIACCADDSRPGEAVAYVTGGAANRAAMQPALARFGYHTIEVIDV
jgi:glutamate racemase